MCAQKLANSQLSLRKEPNKQQKSNEETTNKTEMLRRSGPVIKSMNISERQGDFCW